MHAIPHINPVAYNVPIFINHSKIECPSLFGLVENFSVPTHECVCVCVCACVKREMKSLKGLYSLSIYQYAKYTMYFNKT